MEREDKAVVEALFRLSERLYNKGYNGPCYLDNGYRGPAPIGILGYLKFSGKPMVKAAEEGVAMTIFMFRHPDGEPNIAVSLRPVYENGEFEIWKMSVMETDGKNNILRLLELENLTATDLPPAPEVIAELLKSPQLKPADDTGKARKQDSPMQKVKRKGFKR